MATNFNVKPYYDDYDSSKNFHRVLFRPAYSVQARELTQLQTILQNQITKFGEHIFQNGSISHFFSKTLKFCRHIFFFLSSK